MKTVLVVEDEMSIRDFICLNLKITGYNVMEAETGEDAIRIFEENKNDVDIVLLDIMLPGINGFDVCEYIRANSNYVGIIFLSAKALEEDKITGLNGGADDYITKPFSTSELIARTDSLYRRVCVSKESEISQSSDILCCGDFKLELIKHVLFKDETPIEITQIEFQILECFFRNKGAVISRKFLLDNVWGGPYYGDDKVVDVNIRRLRVKIEKDPSKPEHLITAWGKGYIFQ